MKQKINEDISTLDQRARIAKSIAKRNCPVSLQGFYDYEDAYNTAWTKMWNTAKLGKPINYQATCASNAVIDDVRSWLGRTGNKGLVVVPGASLDANGARDWLPDTNIDRPYEDYIESSDNFDSMIAILDNNYGKEILTRLFLLQDKEKDIASSMKISLKELNRIKEESFYLIKSKIDTLGFIQSALTG